MIEGLGLDPEDLERHVDFWLGRAEAPVEFAAPDDLFWFGALRASRLREAAAALLLLQRVEQAREVLMKAGRAYVELGLTHGVLLEAMAGQTNLAEHPLLRMTSRVAAASRRTERRREDARLADEARERHWRFAALASPLQWLAGWQALRLSYPDQPYREPPERSWEADLQAALRVHSGLNLAGDIPLGVYLGMLARLEEDADRSEAGADLAMTVRRRQRLIEIAQEDTHHWKHALSPMALIDADLLATCMILNAGGDRGAWILDVAFQGATPIGRLPLTVANLLGRPRDSGAPVEAPDLQPA